MKKRFCKWLFWVVGLIVLFVGGTLIKDWQCGLIFGGIFVVASGIIVLNREISEAAAEIHKDTHRDHK